VADIWWVERWFRLLDEAGLPVECLGDGRPCAGSICPLCGQPMVIDWSERRHDITFDCRNACDEEIIALKLGAIP
jgi:hypothetical protein